MSAAGKQLLEFGPFRIDPEQRLLLRDQQPIPLSPKAFDLLLVLALRSGQVVLKDDLMKQLWPDTFVEESNLGQHVFQLRKALGERAQDHAFIATIPGRGYRFVPKVRTVPVVSEEIVVQSHERSRMVIEEETLPERPSAAQVVTRRRIHPAAVLAALAAVVAVAVLFRPAVPAPQLSRIRQLTHLGTLVYNTKLLTDGPRVYFRVWEGHNRVLRYISPEGGEVFPVDSVRGQWEINDLSANGSEFLFTDLNETASKAESFALWRVPVSSDSARPIGELRILDGRWSPDGSLIAYTLNDGLYLANSDGSNPRKLSRTPGEAFYPHWAPDGRRIRFSLADPQGRGGALWQADISRNTVQPLLPDWPLSVRPRAGNWTPDGRYFFFTAQGEETRDIWAMREPQATWRRVNPSPVRLTSGPLDFYYLTPSKDAKTVFALGRQVRGQLQRYNLASRQYLLFAQGVSADHVTFSRDGKWMAYVEFPQQVLVRSRADGSERRQLTFPPMRVFHPQWSADGSQLAFQASADLAAPERIYVVSKDGGTPALATAERNDRQVYPSWSPPGNSPGNSAGDSILFSGSDETGANPALYRVNLKTRQVESLPGTAGLYWGQVSPDGRHVAALTYPNQKLMLYDTTSHETRAIAALADYPIWSADGKYVYFSTLYFRHPDAGVFRWQLSTGKLEKVLSIPDFGLGGIWGVWFGITPQGDPLLVRDMTSTDLYALDLDLP